jgi:hypothetical protein
MASAYGTLANDGIHCKPFAVSRIGQPREGGGYTNLYRHTPQCEEALDPDVAHLITAMLERVVSGGTGRAAAIGRPVAGKTGTAQDYTNVYFAGYTPQVSTAVWVGFPGGQIPMDSYYGGSVFGGTVAAPIWQSFMSQAVGDYPVEGFESPPAPQRGPIPDVVGLKSQKAQEILAEANFSPIVEKVDSFEAPNTVVAQSPGGGASAVLGTAVKIRVSNGKGEPVVVPRVTGLSERRAVRLLEDQGLIADMVRVPVDDRALDGIVVRQTPVGDGEKIVGVGSTVTIEVGEFTGGAGDGGGDGGNGDGDGDAVTPRGRPA